jgi:hypothetical protein
MSEQKLTLEQAADVLARAVRRDAEQTPSISQSELMAIAREAGLSEASVAAELNEFSRGQSFIEFDDVALPWPPAEAARALAETGLRLELWPDGTEWIATVKTPKGKLRIRLTPAADGSTVRLEEPSRLYARLRAASAAAAVLIWIFGIAALGSAFGPDTGLFGVALLLAWTAIMGLVTAGQLSLISAIRREQRIKARALWAACLEKLTHPDAHAGSTPIRRD